MLYFINLAAALLAVDHVNNRNGDVAPYLALPQFERCNVSIPQFLVHDSYSPHDASLSDKSVFIEGSFSDYDVQIMPGFESFDSPTLSFSEDGGYRPCAIVGPSRSDDAIDLSQFLRDRNMDILQISPHAISHVLDDHEEHPLFLRVVTNSENIAKMMMEYLLQIQRDYIGVLYPACKFGESIWNDLQEISLQRNITMEGFSFDESEIYSGNSTSIKSALEQLQKIGFRTCIAIVDSNVEVEFFMNSAHELGMIDDDYLWFLYGRETLFPGDMSMVAVSESPLDQFVRGLGYVSSTMSSEAFLSSLRAQNSTFVKRVQLASPAKYGLENFFAAHPDFFQQEVYSTHIFSEGAFIYDAIVSAALGACNARNAMDKSLRDEVSLIGHISGKALVNEILQLDFVGATGEISFDNGTKSRSLESISLAMLNGRAERVPGKSSNIQRQWFVQTSSTQGGDWVFNASEAFVYSDGSIAPPLPLRWVEENYSVGSDWILIVLAVLSTIGTCACLICFSVVLLHRNSPIVKKAESSYLYMICILCLIGYAGIFCSLMHRIPGKSEATMDMLCSANVVLNMFSIFLFIAAIHLKVKLFTHLSTLIFNHS